MKRSDRDYPEEPIAGEWWLPDDEEKRAGELTYAPQDSPRLSLMNGWSPTVAPSVHLGGGPTIQRPVIHGQSVNRLEAMTLLANTDSGYHTRIGGEIDGHCRSITSDLLVFGKHTSALSRIMLKAMTLEHTNAPLVVRKYGLDLSTRFQEDREGAGYDATAELVEPKKAMVNGTKVVLDVRLVATPQSVTNRGAEIVLRATPKIHICPTKESPAQDFWSVWDNYAVPIDALVRFASDLGGGWFYAGIRQIGDPGLFRVHHRQLVSAVDFEIPQRHESLFDLDCIDDFDALINSWFELYRNYGESIGAGLDGCFARWSNERIRLLALSLEGLSDVAKPHKRRFDKDQLKRAKQFLVSCDGLDPELVEAFGDLSFVTLQARLESIVTKIIDQGVHVPPEVVDHLEHIKRYRNQYSHPPKTNRNGKEEERTVDVSLPRAIDAAKGLFQAVVISQLAMPVATRQNLMQRSLDKAAESIPQWH